MGGLRKGLSLKTRIIGLLSALMILNLAGGVMVLWYSNQMRELVINLIDRELAYLRTAEELQVSLVSQRGLVTYYFLSSDPDWLGQLEGQQEAFLAWLDRASEQAGAGDERRIVEEIEEEYRQYLGLRDEVISLYREGRREKGAELHWKIRDKFAAINALCEKSKFLQNKKIAAIRDQGFSKVRYLKAVSLTVMSFILILGAVLVFFLLHQVLRPIQRISQEAAPQEEPGRLGDEVSVLRRSVHGLLRNVDQTRSELERNQERLLNSEKMAVVGKLAAEVAHSIRNPLTSVKMRLFSLERGLNLSPAQREDLEVTAEEIRRLDNIVGNFLEFSRPPRLRMQAVNITEVVDMCLQLLEKKLERQEILVEFSSRSESLPAVRADPELLKEVIINLLVNACDAMPQGGKILIGCDEGTAERVGRAVLVTISDNGPGVLESLQNKVFEPFFSTKDSGTGLGLSIARRIVEEHGGRLTLRSRPGDGATFIIVLPLLEE